MTNRKREPKAKGPEKKNLRGSIRARGLGLIVGSTHADVLPCSVSQRMTTGRATLNDKTIAIHPEHFVQAPKVFREAARLAEQKQP